MMHVDECKHTFEELASKVLPGHMTRLKKAIAAPHPAAQFAGPGAGQRTLAKQFGKRTDFSGCYVLLDGTVPIYVGISRSVLGRLRQHFRGKSHFNASLAYMMARSKCPIPGGRANAMANKRFKTAFNQAQARLRQCNVAFVEIENPLELYVFEAFAAMALGTYEWNTFRTH
jgi:hypothetical protein